MKRSNLGYLIAPLVILFMSISIPSYAVTDLYSLTNASYTIRFNVADTVGTFTESNSTPVTNYLGQANTLYIPFISVASGSLDANLEITGAPQVGVGGQYATWYLNILNPNWENESLVVNVSGLGAFFDAYSGLGNGISGSYSGSVATVSYSNGNAELGFQLDVSTPEPSTYLTLSAFLCAVGILGYRKRAVFVD